MKNTGVASFSAFHGKQRRILRSASVEKNEKGDMVCVNSG